MKKIQVKEFLFPPDSERHRKNKPIHTQIFEGLIMSMCVFYYASLFVFKFLTLFFGRPFFRAVTLCKPAWLKMWTTISSLYKLKTDPSAEMYFKKWHLWCPLSTRNKHSCLGHFRWKGAERSHIFSLMKSNMKKVNKHVCVRQHL